MITYFVTKIVFFMKLFNYNPYLRNYNRGKNKHKKINSFRHKACFIQYSVKTYIKTPLYWKYRGVFNEIYVV